MNKLTWRWLPKYIKFGRYELAMYSCPEASKVSFWTILKGLRIIVRDSKLSTLLVIRKGKVWNKIGKYWMDY